VYFIDAMAVLENGVDVWAGDLDVDDRTAALAEEVMVKFMGDIVSGF
jgi:hypothetical protein